MSTNILCPVCRRMTVETLAHVPHVPVLCNVLWESRCAAQEVPRVEIPLSFCKSCGHIFNPAFDASLMDYSAAYENSLHYSPRFQAYAEQLANDLVARHDLYGRDIIEIGSGKGDFLEMLCELGDNRGVGFDPSYVPGETHRSGTHRIEFIRAFYSEAYQNRQADIIICRHTLEHIPEPASFMQMVRRTVGTQNTTLFFEVPNGLCTLQEMAIWDIIYEHCSYFTKYSLAFLFEASGFEVLDIRTTFGGQYLCIEAKPKADCAISTVGTWNQPARLDADVEAFAQRFQEKTAEQRNLLAEMRSSGKKAVVWGSGSKGVTFLNMLSDVTEIEYAVDINPRKQGKYITGAGQQIVGPQALVDYRPDVVIVMNSIYLQEIARTVQDLGLAPEIVAV